MNQPLDFQTIIMNLQRFWADQGCLIWQPYYSQVGAGTYNPATYLRVLGPEPWKVAYVEPSVRPDDGRYGENPNRLQQHTQFQVILKPDPGNPQEVFLQSLESLGIDPGQHDIRFVEDNWESPALGAWGLGWEVWLDGQEITQFTYFQQAGGITLNPVSVEITYGLERIGMALQNVRNFRAIRWSPTRTHGDVNLLGEQEHSKYYFEIANVERARKMLELFEAEAVNALENGLVLPAHDYVLKCSHTFNILDTRGAVGVTERAALFARMRDLSSRVARAYLEQRQRLGFPWLSQENPDVEQSPTPADPCEVISAQASIAIHESADLLFEIGTEELPASDLESALVQLRQSLPEFLDDQRLKHGDIFVQGTPRRLVILIKDLAAHQPDLESIAKGPPASRAFDALGQPTPAAEGFARSRGLEAKDLQVAEIDGGRYVVARVFEKGQDTAALLAEMLPNLLQSLRFTKSMRWNSSGIFFSRPIRWLLALYGGQVVKFHFAGVCSGNQTRGLRFQHPEYFLVEGLSAYQEFLKKQGIRLDPMERRENILSQTRKQISEVGGDPEIIDPGLLDEVTGLVETPTALRGSFDPEHLRLPTEVLIAVMQKYQRYFPVYQPDGSLLPHFVIIRNGSDQHSDVVTDGNEQVIHARFADAGFFIKEDLRQKLEDFLPRLETLIFQTKLGSMLDKSKRIEKLVEKLIPSIGLGPQDAFYARRTAQLCKADLVTQMVTEMTALQGIMGRYYARKWGEPEPVAQALFEGYLPRFAGDKMPESLVGLTVGIADRLDSLAGLFTAGLAPSGAKDPFAQRRTALGLVQILIKAELNFDLHAALGLASEGLPIPASSEHLAACLDFMIGRLQSHLAEQGYRYDVVAAVLAEQGTNPFSASRAVEQLSRWVAQPEWNTILPAYARCVRITRTQPEQYPIDPAVLEDPAEHDLFRVLLLAENEPRQSGSVDGFFKSFLPMIPVINQFFDKVLVMDEQPGLRANRLGLLQRVAALARGIADFSKLEGF